MKNAIILHGWPSKEEYYDPQKPSLSNAHWFPWLQSHLLKAGVAAATPEVPNSFELNWPVWVKEFERFDITPSTTLIGHSAGGGFILKYLSIHPTVKVGKVVLVAPWLDPDNESDGKFFDGFEMDTNLVGRTQGITIFASDNDDDDVKKTIASLRNKVRNLRYQEFHNYGHFCYKDMHTVEFPALLDEALA